MTQEKQPLTSILVVDDDPDQVILMQRWLESAGYSVRTADNGRAALADIEQQMPTLVLTDLAMQQMDGLKLLSEIHQQNPILPVAIISGEASIPQALKAAHLGVAAFLQKPVEKQLLLDTVTDMLEQNRETTQQPESPFAPGLIHRSMAMSRVLQRAFLVASQQSSILIQGATGNGKELLAHAIHDASSRSDMPFIAINCSALPEQLLESELFGHVKGAFTNATQSHRGLFQAADNGTLFLDEIGEMPLTLQAKLLRVLQDFHIRAVGSTLTTSVDVRIIAASNQNLADKVAAGEFREDLYYRLNVVPLHLPNLDKRREDIPLLIEYFLQKMADRNEGNRKTFAPDALKHLVAADWPGNVRQLQNVVEYCYVLTTGTIITLDLAQEASTQRSSFPTLDEAKSTFERRYLSSLLRTTNGKVSEAAQLAGRNRTEFYKLLNRHAIEPAAYRQNQSD